MFQQTKRLIITDLDKKVFPGVDVAFIHKNTSERMTIGYEQLLPYPVSLKSDYLFDLASLTKVVGTTSVLMRLYQQNLFSFDDPLQKYLPEFNTDKITIRHLLTHTSDIDPFIPNRNQLEQSQLIKAYYHLNIGNCIGKKVKYTDAGLILLGFLIEYLTKMSVQQAITNNVLIPLGMYQTTFTPDYRKCIPTEKTEKRGIIKGVVHDPKALVLGEHCASAGLFSNVSDLSIFVNMLLNDGKSKFDEPFFTKDTLNLLQHDQTPNKRLARTFGWELGYYSPASLPVIFHTGYTGTLLVVDLVKKCGLIFLSNRVHPVDNKKEYVMKRDQLIQTYLSELTNI